jgi:phosphate starvation-inducible PhoH-like protein
MLTPDEIDRFREKGVIEVAPLAYMRGRTLNNAFIILDEAQNTTQEQMFMFLTRLGFNSKCIITGDITQVDLPRSKQSGLIEAKNLLQHIDDISFVELEEEDVVRHPIVQKVIRAYRERPSATKGEQA